jgi:hypothetical protein
MQNIIKSPDSERKWRNTLKMNDIDFNMVYTKKVKLLKELKIREFNYKVLHLILVCNKNRTDVTYVMK